MALVAFFNTEMCTLKGLVEDEVGVQFVDCVVCQVHKPVLEVFAAGCSVFLSGKASEAFLIDEYAERVSACQEHIDPHVEL